MGKEPKVSRLIEIYRGNIVPNLVKEFGYKNIMQVPRLKKITLNIGMGEALQNAKSLEAAEKDLAAISGQRPVKTIAKRSIAAFKLRKGMIVGLTVTLRGQRMYEFLDRLVNVALGRIRDFRGISRTAFDGHGNYTLGVKEQLMFPEIEYDKIDKTRGMEVTIGTTARSDAEGKRLLELFGAPFERD